MENENDYGMYGLPITINDELGYNGTIASGTVFDNHNNYEFQLKRDISIPETFKDIILKLCPEIKDIVSIGYRENGVYDPMTFNPIYKYLVGVDIYFNETNGLKKSKVGYGELFNDYFNMTYSDVDFVTFHVQSFIFPPEKSNREKFLELFGTM